MTLQDLIDLRNEMNLRIDEYKDDRTEGRLEVARQAMLAYIAAIRGYYSENREVDVTTLFSNPTLMTRAVIEDVKRVISGRGLNLPEFLRVTMDGSARVTSDGSYRVYATE